MLHPDDFDKPSPRGNPRPIAPPPPSSSPAIPARACVVAQPQAAPPPPPVPPISSLAPTSAFAKLLGAFVAFILVGFLVWTIFSRAAHQQAGAPILANPAPAPNVATPIANDAALDVLGLWTLTTEWDANYFGTTQRYHANATYSVQIDRAENGFRARWHETRDDRNLDDPGKLLIAYDAIFSLRTDGNRLIGNSESARVRFGDNGWQDLISVPFTGTLLPSGQLQFEIDWQRDGSGQPNNVSNSTLQRPPVPARAAPAPEEENRQAADSDLEGSWTLQSDWEGRFTDNNQRYRATATYSVEIHNSGDGFQVVVHELRDIYYIENLNRFTLECQGTFNIRRDGNQLTGPSDSAALHFDNAAWQNLGAASFSRTLLSPAQLQFEVLWQRGTDGKEVTGARGVLQRH